MSLLMKIKADQLAARKKYAETTFEKYAVDSRFLTTLYAEAAKVGKDAGNRETTDAEVVAVLKKFQKNIEETKKATRGKEVHETLDREVAILERYLPKQLTEGELIDKVLDLRSKSIIGDLKGCMAYFKSHYAGQYDGAVLSRVARELL